MILIHSVHFIDAERVAQSLQIPSDQWIWVSSAAVDRYIRRCSTLGIEFAETLDASGGRAALRVAA